MTEERLRPPAAAAHGVDLPAGESAAEPPGLTAHARANRAAWNRDSDEYQERHGSQLRDSGGLAWGVWQVPEAELGILGDVTGLDILELGCGAAQWSIALAKRGANPAALDLSDVQLGHARRLMEEAGVSFPLLHASAESIPLPDSSFDIVFCDWGATTFSDPYLTVPEAARLLRPGGLFAFSGCTPLYRLCLELDKEVAGERLVHDYFGMHRFVEDEYYVEFMLPYGEWIRLFRRNGLAIEDLVEIRPPADASSTYTMDAGFEWARRWPYEHVWKLRKEG
ncbi:MAG: class I SAM-dependent methyltransferase [Thermoleophilia bacterium]